MAGAQTCGSRAPRLPSSLPQRAPSSSAGWNPLSRAFSCPELCQVSTLQRSGVLLVAKSYYFAADVSPPLFRSTRIRKHRHLPTCSQPTLSASLVGGLLRDRRLLGR